MKAALALVVLAACGGSPPPQPAPVANTTPVTQPPPPPPPPTKASFTGIPDCDALIDAYSALAACPGMPPQSRDAMQQGLDTMKKGWGDLRAADAQTKQAVGDGCKQGLDGVKQAASAAGC